MNDREYLENLLFTKNMEKREVEVQRRVALAEFNVRLSKLSEDILSIEKQLK